jgi:Tfp pilus assembly protein PilN
MDFQQPHTHTLAQQAHHPDQSHHRKLMLKKKIQRILEGNTAAGVECYLLPGGGMELSFVLLERHGENVRIAAQGVKLQGIQELRKRLPAGVPAHLVIEGKGVLHREVDLADHSRSSLLHQLFPQAKSGDFYLQHSPGINEQVFVSVARKEAADKIITQLAEEGITVVHCSIGSLGAVKLLPLLGSGRGVIEELQLGHCRLLLEGSKIKALEPQTGQAQAYTLGAQQIGGELLLPFSAALAYFTGSPGCGSELAVTNAKEFRQQKIFRLSAATYVLGLLVLLLANYYLFDRFSKKYLELQSAVSLNENILVHCDTLQKQVDAKKSFLERQGLLQDSRTSWYANQLALSLPPGIRLTRMNVNPIELISKDGEETLQVNQHTIAISGACDQSAVLNDWMKKLKQLNWVTDADLLNYSQDKRAGEGTFTIQVKLA